jgi:energy-coupling factor transport system permease protein
MSFAFYRPTDRLFDKVHPVTKVLTLVAAFVPPFFGNNPVEVSTYLALLLFTGLYAGAGPNMWRFRKLMTLLFLMSAGLWAFFQPGATVLFSIGPIAAKQESLLYGITVGLRLNCFVLTAVTFLTCTKIEDFTYALSRLGLPFVASFALSLAFRLTPLFMEAGSTIVMAQKARGLDLDSGGPITRTRRYVPIIVPVLVSGLRRADQLAIALESKGFGRSRRRTVLSEFSFGWRDLLLMLVIAIIVAGGITRRVLTGL